MIALAGATLGFGVAAIFTGLILGYSLFRWASRHFPQVVGTAVSTLSMMVVSSLAAGLMGPVFLHAGSLDLGFGNVLAPLAPALMAWIRPHRGVHRGWSATLGQVPVLASVGASFALPAQAAALSLLAALCAVAVVELRSRMSLPGTRAGQPAQRGRGRRLLVKGGAVAGIAMVLLTLSALAVPQKASAQMGWLGNIGDSMLCGIVAPQTSPQPVGSGIESVIPAHNMTGLNAVDGSEAPYLNKELAWPEGSLGNYTLYELSGLRGTNYINWVKDDEGENTHCAFQPWISVMGGNAINTITRFGMQVTIWLKEFAQVKDPFRFLYEPFTPVVNTFLSAAVGLLGIAYLFGLGVAAIRAVRGNNLQQATSNVSGAILTALIAGIAYGGLAAQATWDAPRGNGFYTVVSYVDGVTGLLNASISNEVLSLIPQAEGAMCAKPDGSVEESGQRYSSCLLAEAMVWQPWALATFGPDGNRPIDPAEGSEVEALPCYNDYGGCADLRSYLISQIGGPDITGKIDECLGRTDYDPEANQVDNYDAFVTCEPYHAVAAHLMVKASNGESKPLTAFRGDSAGGMHITQALSSLLAVFTIGLGLAAVAAATIYWHGRLLILFLFGPVILLNAAFRGPDGAVKWVQEVFQTLIARLIYGLLTTFLIFLVSLILSMDIAFAYKWIIMVVLMMSTLKILRKSDEMSAVGQARDVGGAASVMDMTQSALVGNLGAKVIAGASSRAAGSVGRMANGGLGQVQKLDRAVETGVGKAAEVGSRPVRNATNVAKGRMDGYRNVRAGAGSSAVGDVARGASNIAQTATTAGTGATTAAASAGAAAVGAAAGAAAGSRVGGRAANGGTGAPRRDAGFTAQQNARNIVRDDERAQRAREEAPVEGDQQETPAGRVTGASTRVRNAASSTGRSVGAAFRRPTPDDRLRASDNEEVFRDWKHQENDSRFTRKEDVLSVRERRQMRDEIRRTPHSDIVERNPRMTADERAKRLAELKEQQAQGQQPRKRIRRGAVATDEGEQQ